MTGPLQFRPHRTLERGIRVTGKECLNSKFDSHLIRVLARMALHVIEEPDPDAHAMESGPRNLQPRAGQMLTGRRRKRRGKQKAISGGQTETI
jgi:hypothetical protein